MTFRQNFGGVPGQYDEELKFYGRDAFFDNDTRIASDGDWTTVEGIEHVRRSMIRRVLVVPGTYRLRPSYGAGLSVYVKKPFTSTSRADMVARITAQVGLMRQIDKVISVEMTEEVDGAGTQYVRVFVRAQVLNTRVEFEPFKVSRGN